MQGPILAFLHISKVPQDDSKMRVSWQLGPLLPESALSHYVSQFSELYRSPEANLECPSPVSLNLTYVEIVGLHGAQKLAKHNVKVHFVAGVAPDAETPSSWNHLEGPWKWMGRQVCGLACIKCKTA